MGGGAGDTEGGGRGCCPGSIVGGGAGDTEGGAVVLGALWGEELETPREGGGAVVMGTCGLHEPVTGQICPCEEPRNPLTIISPSLLQDKEELRSEYVKCLKERDLLRENMVSEELLSRQLTAQNTSLTAQLSSLKLELEGYGELKNAKMEMTELKME